MIISKHIIIAFSITSMLINLCNCVPSNNRSVSADIIRNLYVFEAKSLPEDESSVPTLSNGHIGFTVFSDAVYMNGLYNGEMGLSHRARIPNYSNLKVVTDCDEKSSSCKYRLDAKAGLFEVEYEAPGNGFKVKHLIYPHRFHNRAIVNQIYVYRNMSEGDITIKLIQQNGGNTTSNYEQYQDVVEDIKYNSTKIIFIQTKNNARKLYKVYKKCGNTIELEDKKYQKSERHVCVLWNHVPEEITLKNNKNIMSFKFLMTVDENFRLAKQEMMDALSLLDDSLLKLHIDEWKTFWKNFHVKTEGNSELESTIESSLYYLTSSLPSLNSNLQLHPFYGLSPTGLGRGGRQLNDYEGHSFWDTEIWMLPPINLIEPKWTKKLLNYRFIKLQAAQDNANNSGYAGARFPWESAFTGRDVTQPCCPLVSQNQQHVTADISFAIRSYFATTHDTNWLKREGCLLSNQIAEFWSNRVSFNHTTGYYDIKYVMGPDEDHENVTNNVYTNVVAGYSLYFGEFTNCLCNKLNDDNRENQKPYDDGNKNWIEIAEHIKLLYDEKKDYHPQYESYEMGTKIKQADAILLGYPLLYKMNRTTKSNDLRTYENVTRDSGPAMTWAMHAINHLDLNEYEQADAYFNKSYKNYVRKPFNVWSEVVAGEVGATNFITGAGGFLQAILNGYGGIHVRLDHLEISNGRLPPQTEKFVINGISYLGSKFLLTIQKNLVVLKCTRLNKKYGLSIQIGKLKKDICNNCKYDITKQKTLISAKISVYQNCPIPSDIIGNIRQTHDK